MKVLAADPTLSDFNQLIWWMVLLKVGIVFVFLLLTTIFMIWFERRVIGRMQNRPGPHRGGPGGAAAADPRRAQAAAQGGHRPDRGGQAGVLRRADHRGRAGVRR